MWGVTVALGVWLPLGTAKVPGYTWPYRALALHLRFFTLEIAGVGTSDFVRLVSPDWLGNANSRGMWTMRRAPCPP